MWIRSQDKKRLVFAIKFSVEKVISFKSDKSYIYVESHSGSVENLGEYESFDHAIRELDSLQNFISENPTKVYQLK